MTKQEYIKIADKLKHKRVEGYPDHFSCPILMKPGIDMYPISEHKEAKLVIRLVMTTDIHEDSFYDGCTHTTETCLHIPFSKIKDLKHIEDIIEEIAE